MPRAPATLTVNNRGETGHGVPSGSPGDSPATAGSTGEDATGAPAARFFLRWRTVASSIEWECVKLVSAFEIATSVR